MYALHQCLMEHHVTRVVVVAITYLAVCNLFTSSQENIQVEPLVATESSDFARVVNSSFFVDKTALIKALCSDSSTTNRLLKVRPGPHFSKSTNVNMLKRFFEITVDENGTLEDAKSTNNYKLFTQNYLEIFQYKHIFDNYFGKYPIVMIHYKPLENVRNYKHLLLRYKEVFKNTFTEHKYLLGVEELWSSELNKTEFIDYLIPKENFELNKSKVLKGIKFLSSLLHRHFGKRVIVLVDDFDIIMDSPLSEKYRDKVFDLFLSVEKALLDNKDDVFCAFLTGCRRREQIPGDAPVSLSADSVLWQYYGLSHDQLVQLLRRFIQDNREVEVAANTVVDLYSGYVRDFDSYDISDGVNYRTISVCSVWSVIQFFVCMRNTSITMI